MQSYCHVIVKGLTRCVRTKTNTSPIDINYLPLTMNDCKPPTEDHIVTYQGQTQLWDAIGLGNWKDVENILNSNLITLEQKCNLIKINET